MVMMISECQYCHTKYEFRKSQSSLKLTWCSAACEQRDLGYHLLSLEAGKFDRMRLIHTEDTVVEATVVPVNDVGEEGDWEEYELCPA